MTIADLSAEMPSSVDLTSCDREPIHQIGAIQSIGFLVVLSADWVVARVSANAADHLGVAVDALLGAPFSALVCAEASHAIRNRLSALYGANAVERAFAVQLLDGGPHYDLAIHLTKEMIVIEAEPSEAAGDFNAGAMVRSMLTRIESNASIPELARTATRLIYALTGFDRVMVYKFHPDGSGEVIAERVGGGLEPYIGLRYPASDIPVQARALLVRNPVRVLFDVTAETSPIVPRLGPTGQSLDLSMSTLRAHSLMHIEYLQNMGVRATMTISLVRDGMLWGLIACHHMSPRHVGFARRTAAELFAHTLGLLLDRVERTAIADYETRTRQLHNLILATVAEKGSVGDNIAKLSDQLAELVPSDGLAICIDRTITLTGATPTREEVAALRRFLDGNAASQVYATDELGRVYPPARDFVQQAAGILAIPISRVPRDFLIFFRHEVARSVIWAGDPNKSVQAGPDGERLTPRKSFAAWREIKRGMSAPWTSAEQRGADGLRLTLLEVVLRVLAASETDRQSAMQKQELLIAELNHRVRNSLGLIHGLITHSKISASDVDTFAAVLGERVHALARAHDQITAKNWGPGSLATLIATEAGAYLGIRADRVRAPANDILLQPQAFSIVSLVIHELMTNSAKYGALTVPHGQIMLDWTIDEAKNLVMDWSEIGGPAVQAPKRRGFGSLIIERSIPHELGGEATLNYAVTGLCARFVVPSRHVAPADAAPPPPSRTTVAGPPARLSGVVLLLEDNMIIALDAEEMLLSLGADRVSVASNVSDALRLLGIETPSFALLDVNLGEETSFVVADRLRQMGVQHIFASGYGAGVNYPADHRATPSITKPYTAESISRAVHLLAAQGNRISE